MIKIYRYSLIYAVGSVGYGALEIAFRGKTHWSMLIVGGACLTVLYNIALKSRRPLWQKWIIGGAAITAIEFVAGLIVNVALGWNVWSYADMPLNFMGQICPLFSLFWCLLCIPVMWMCKYMGRERLR